MISLIKKVIKNFFLKRVWPRASKNLCTPLI